METKTRVIIGNALDSLKLLSDKSVHCIVTSPPYWGLRDYSKCKCTHSASSKCSSSTLAGGGNATPNHRKEPNAECPVCKGTGVIPGCEPKVWGGDDKCVHDWFGAGGGLLHHNRNGLDGGRVGGNKIKETNTDDKDTKVPSALCSKCGAWFGQLGLEPNPEQYVFNIATIMMEAYRVLRDDGTLWLNIGDCYASATDWSRADRQDLHCEGLKRKVAPGLKTKDLVGIPWMVAFELRARGWYLRNDNIWYKRNCMPEPCKDRFVKAHEYVFLMAKSIKYFFDSEDVKEPYAESSIKETLKRYKGVGKKDYEANGVQNPSDVKRRIVNSIIFGSGRNRRTVMEINTKPYKDAHFATFPETLPEICIRAGTSEKGCCIKCGAPFERVLKRDTFIEEGDLKVNQGKIGKHNGKNVVTGGTNAHSIQYSQAFWRAKGYDHDHPFPPYKTIGWKPTCYCVKPDNVVKHPETTNSFGEIEEAWAEETWNKLPEHCNCVVLDMFAGSGTTGAVANRLGRDAILIELNPQYVKLIEERLNPDLRKKRIAKEKSLKVKAESLEKFK